MTNVESVRGLYEAFAKGDVPTVLAFLDSNIAWTEAEASHTAVLMTGPTPCSKGSSCGSAQSGTGLRRCLMNSLMPPIP